MKNDTKTQAVIPVIVVDDVRKAINFYSQLGFKEQVEYSFQDENGRLVHAQIFRDGSVLFLGTPGVSYYESKPRAKGIKNTKPEERGLGLTLILQTDNLDNIYRIIRKHRLEILYEPANEYYGDRVFLFLDPFGYEWKVSQPIL